MYTYVYIYICIYTYNCVFVHLRGNTPWSYQSPYIGPMTFGLQESLAAACMLFYVCQGQGDFCQFAILLASSWKAPID